jgi:hypothetical protein
LNSVSRVVPYVIAVVGGLTLVLVLVFLMQSRQIFTAVPASGCYSTPVLIQAAGATRKAAVAVRDAARTRAMAFLAGRGFSATQAMAEAPAEVVSYPNSSSYEADQQIDVCIADYAKLARTDNAIAAELEPGGTIVGGFPAGTFFPISIAIALGCLVLLTLAASALETREADVARAPRGMHPVIIGAQTMLYGLLVALAVVYGHVLAPPSKIPFVAVSLLGIGLLCIWLWKTRRWWKQSTFLHVSWGAYVLGIAGIVIAVAWALAQPLT